MKLIKSNDFREKYNFKEESRAARKEREKTHHEVVKNYQVGKKILELYFENVGVDDEQIMDFLLSVKDDDDGESFLTRCVKMNRDELKKYATKATESRFYNRNQKVVDERIRRKWMESDELLRRTYKRMIAAKVIALAMLIATENEQYWAARKIKEAEFNCEEGRELQALTSIKNLADYLMRNTA